MGLRLVLLIWLGLAQSISGSAVSVVSYNNYWWNVRQNSRWSSLYSRISSNRADLYGFQECNNVQQVLQGSSLGGYQSFQGPFPNPAPLAWKDSVFSRIGGPASIWVAKDQWGDRHMNWVRLRHRASGRTVFFANTHGPLNNCGDSVGARWAQGITSNRQSGDIVIMTGDFNCAVGTAAMRRVLAVVDRGVKHGIDHILTSATGVSGSARDGSPSDHPLIAGTITLGSGGPSPTPAPSGSCGAAWNTNAGGHTCGSRIQWLQTNRGMSDRDAQNIVASEFPRECGACAVSGGSCNDGHQHCGYWSQHGYCGGSYAAYMQQNCRRSCGHCASDQADAPNQMAFLAAPNSTGSSPQPAGQTGQVMSSCFIQIVQLLPLALILGLHGLV
jgi:hypothetical protein